MSVYRIVSSIGPLVLLLAAFVFGPQPARAQNEVLQDAQLVVNKALSTLETMKTASEFPETWRPRLDDSRAILIVPEQYKAGFIIGGEYGIGVLMVRQPDGSVAGPAFYKIYTGSIGLQIGGQKSESVFMIMTDAGLQAVMQDEFKAGAGAGVSIAHKGGGIEASTTSNLNADIFAYSRAVGFYGGGTLEGAVIKPHREFNAAYYDTNLAIPDAILQGGTYSNPGADALKAAIAAPPQ